MAGAIGVTSVAPIVRAALQVPVAGLVFGGGLRPGVPCRHPSRRHAVVPGGMIVAVWTFSFTVLRSPCELLLPGQLV